MAQVRDVVFVEGVRTPFGKASKKGIYAETRADDLVVNVFRELLRRNPSLPPERIDDVAVAATTQTGDQGLTIGRSAALLSGLPKSVPGYSVDRMCAGAMTAVTSLSSPIMAGMYDIALAGGVEQADDGAGVGGPAVVLVEPGAGGEHRREQHRQHREHEQGRPHQTGDTPAHAAPPRRESAAAPQ